MKIIDVITSRRLLIFPEIFGNIKFLQISGKFTTLISVIRLVQQFSMSDSCDAVLSSLTVFAL